MGFGFNGSREASMDEPDNLTLRYLRRIDEKLDLVIDRVNELTRRTGTLEISVANLSSRVDRIEARLDRVYRRLDLLDEAGLVTSDA
jgi:predicted nuclease with TOPRIM domain